VDSAAHGTRAEERQDIHRETPRGKGKTSTGSSMHRIISERPYLAKPLAGESRATAVIAHQDGTRSYPATLSICRQITVTRAIACDTLPRSLGQARSVALPDAAFTLAAAIVFLPAPHSPAMRR
jgi:hypothetical protein